MATPAYPYLQEVIGRTGTVTLRDESNAAKRVWRLVFNAPQLSLPNPENYDLPKIGDQHPTITDAILQSWEVSEESSASFILTANYSTPASSDPSAAADEEEEEVETAREWSGGESSRDLCADAVTGEVVMLPTGEPFESVPSVPVSVMTFSVTRKTKKFNADLLAANCTVNASPVTIDGITIAKHCGRLKVTQKKLYGGSFRYEVTLSVDIVSNIVKLEPDAEPVDIGHDVALLLSGFRFFSNIEEGGGNAGDAVLVTATELDQETWEEKPASAPALLNPDGFQYVPGDSVAPQSAYYKRYAAIKEFAWSNNWFGEK